MEQNATRDVYIKRQNIRALGSLKKYLVPLNSLKNMLNCKLLLVEKTILGRRFFFRNSWGFCKVYK